MFKKLLLIISILLFSTDVLSEELKVYEMEDVIIKDNYYTATKKDGTPLTGSVVTLRDKESKSSNVYFDKAVMNYKNGKWTEHLLYNGSLLLVEKKLGDGKILSMKQYYANGNLWKDSAFYPYIRTFTYYKNGNRMMEKEEENTKIYNTDGVLIAEINTHTDNPYSVCILKDGTKKNMTEEQYKKLDEEYAKQGIDGEYQPVFICE